MTHSSSPSPTSDTGLAHARTAVVLARGLGTRMRAATDNPAVAALTPAQAAAAASGYKALMPIGEHLLVDYSLSALADAGIERVVLVVGPEHDAFDTHIADLAPKRLHLELAVQVEPRGTADAVASARHVVGSEPFLMVNGDNYYPVDGLRTLAQTESYATLGFDRAAMVAHSNIPADRIAAFALLKVSDGYLADILEKPSSDVVGAAGDHALISMNAFRFEPDIFDICSRIEPSARGEYEIVDAVRALPTPMAVLPIEAGVLDLSRREDIADVQARLAGVEVNV